MKKIHIFYALDEDFLKYTCVSMLSLIDNASKKYNYVIHILNSGISEKEQKKLKLYESSVFNIEFNDVSSYLHSLKDSLPIRDYYTRTTYYRLFIAEMFPKINKAIYLDSDTVVLGDISNLYNTKLGGALLAASSERVMMKNKIFGEYAEKVVGVKPGDYFNAGILVMNLKKMRKTYMLESFIELLSRYKFKVTQDEDYLNVIAKGKVKYLDESWNVQTYKNITVPEKEMNLIHYVMNQKPWHYKECPLSKYFWQYCAESVYEEEIKAILSEYTDEDKANDSRCVTMLEKLAKDEIEGENTYVKISQNKPKAPDRVAVLNKIRDYEINGRFGDDVEEDPPAPVLMPDDIDYLREGLSAKIRTCAAKIAARLFLNKILKKKIMIVDEIKGTENLKKIEGGAVITCNHFNALDSFAMQMAYESQGRSRHRLFRVIREGNYTNYPGFYGFLMRNYDTLPLSSNVRTMRKFMRATDEILARGDRILIYPEQSMWWNYKKPKPLKPGAYTIAAKNSVPVVPCFITMKDSDLLDSDGFFVQKYTINILPPIYPDPEKSYRENIVRLQDENARVWKEVYESTYGIPLSYEKA